MVGGVVRQGCPLRGGVNQVVTVRVDDVDDDAAVLMEELEVGVHQQRLLAELIGNGEVVPARGWVAIPREQALLITPAASTSASQVDLEVSTGNLPAFGLPSEMTYRCVAYVGIGLMPPPTTFSVPQGS